MERWDIERLRACIGAMKRNTGATTAGKVTAFDGSMKRAQQHERLARRGALLMLRC